MKKRISITEEQFKRLVEGTFSYFGDLGSGTPPKGPENIYSSGGTVDGKPAEPESGDEISHIMEPQDTLWNNRKGNTRSQNVGTLNCGAERKKKLQESNSSLEGNFFKFSPRVLEKLRRLYDSSTAPGDSKGRMRLSQLIDSGGMKYSEATTIKSLMDKMGPESSEYMNMGGKDLYDFIDRTLKMRTALSKTASSGNKRKVKGFPGGKSGFIYYNNGK